MTVYKNHKIAWFGVLATLIIGLIGAGITLYTHFDKDVGLRTEEIKRETKESKSEERTSITVSIAEVFVTPIDTKMPSSFYVELKNTSLECAKNINLTVDFGESKPIAYEWVPINNGKLISAEGESIQTIVISELKPNQSFYLTCNLSAPYFKSIIVDGGNLTINKKLTYQKYREQREGKGVSFYGVLWRALLIGLLVLLFIFLLLKMFV